MISLFKQYIKLWHTLLPSDNTSLAHHCCLQTIHQALAHLLLRLQTIHLWHTTAAFKQYIKLWHTFTAFRKYISGIPLLPSNNTSSSGTPLLPSDNTSLAHHCCLQTIHQALAHLLLRLQTIHIWHTTAAFRQYIKLWHTFTAFRQYISCIPLLPSDNTSSSGTSLPSDVCMMLL